MLARKTLGAIFLEEGSESMAARVREEKRQRVALLTDHHGHRTLNSYGL